MFGLCGAEFCFVCGSVVCGVSELCDGGVFVALFAFSISILYGKLILFAILTYRDIYLKLKRKSCVIISGLRMTCMWCESEDYELIKYCGIEDHRVCVLCYERYRKRYPLRVEGCPYCKGTEEKLVVYVRHMREGRNHQIYQIYSQTALVHFCICCAGAVFFMSTFGVMYWCWFYEG